MNNEFKKTNNKIETRYVLENTSAAIATVPTALGTVRSRSAKEGHTVGEGAVKDLMHDIKHMSSEEFYSKYKMTKADAMKQMQNKSDDSLNEFAPGNGSNNGSMGWQGFLQLVTPMMRKWGFRAENKNPEMMYSRQGRTKDEFYFIVLAPDNDMVHYNFGTVEVGEPMTHEENFVSMDQHGAMTLLQTADEAFSLSDLNKGVAEGSYEYNKKTGQMGLNNSDKDQRHGLYVNGKLVKTYNSRDEAENVKKRDSRFKTATVKKITEATGNPKNTVTSPKPRNPVMAGQNPGRGTVKHKDKKKEMKQGKEKHKKPLAENFPHADHEISMANSELLSIRNDAAKLLNLVRQYSELDGLEAWQQSKITKAADYLTSVLRSIKGEQAMQDLAEDWQKVNKKDKTDGMSPKAVKAYRRENPGSKLKTAVTKKPSELKAGSKDANRRKSFCARMSGNKGPMKDEKGRPTPKAKALNRWNCEESVLESIVNEKSPPGMEDVVLSLKKKYPKEKAYAIAWSQYNKKKKKVSEGLSDEAFKALQLAKQKIEQQRTQDLAAWEKDFMQNMGSRYNSAQATDAGKNMPVAAPQTPTPVVNKVEPATIEKHSVLQYRMKQLNKAINKQIYLDEIEQIARKNGALYPGLEADIDTSLYVKDGARDNYEGLNQKLDKAINQLSSRLSLKKIRFAKFDPTINYEEEKKKKDAKAKELAQTNDVSEARATEYDAELEIINPAFETDNVEPEVIAVGVNYSISGYYRPSTWGSYGGQPEEHPDMEITAIVRLDTGEDISSSLTPDDLSNLESKLWKIAEKKQQNDYDPYHESLDMMLEGQLNPAMGLNVWQKNFLNANPYRYRQFMNKTPAKKK